MPATTAKAPDIASVSIPDTLAALHVDPETGLIRGLPLARPSARQWVSACVLHLISNTQNLSLRQQIGTKKTYIERKIRKLLVDDVGVDLPIEIHRNQVENAQRHHIYCFDYFPNRLCRC
jgi:hypothetical protein